ncbi:hypothetical protein MRB53_013339 [Persea americana]|uniref:Uncharacterized protein n=1 Tax=Persea americana TaxID=3435 RepID=A0ACC2K7P0_PERAE|nr:hypothetical protein MRB53_013339 [Persea americana]
MIKALRKIKNWSSRKKKRRKSNIFQPPSYPHCCSCGTPPPLPPLQPTAPPLPSWLDFDYQQDEASGSVPASTFPTQHQFELLSPEITSSESTPLYVPQPLPMATSYQQYLAPAPVYGMPVTPSTPVNSTRRGISPESELMSVMGAVYIKVLSMFEDSDRLPTCFIQIHQQ